MAPLATVVWLLNCGAFFALIFTAGHLTQEIRSIQERDMGQPQRAFLSAGQAFADGHGVTLDLESFRRKRSGGGDPLSAATNLSYPIVDLLLLTLAISSATRLS